MSGTPGRRGLRGRKLRPLFEKLLLAASVVAGLGVVGSCGWAGVGASGRLSVLGVVVGALVAITVVGAVFLFTTMSRDLRFLREHYLKDGTALAARQPPDDRSPLKGAPDTDL